MSSFKPRRELRKIAEYRALCIAKYTLILFLVLVYYPMRPTPGYYIIFLLGLPFLFRATFFTLQNGKKDAVESFSLRLTAKKYGFTMQNLNSEKTSGNLVLIFIILWQYSAIRHESYEQLYLYIPGILAVIYLAARIICKNVYFYYLHNNFMSMKIEE